MKKCLVLLAALALISAPVHAKWWIFGGSNESVSIKYLYFNGIAAEDTGPKLTFYQSLLKGSGVKVTGRAVAGQGSIGYVRVSLDGKKTWNDAKIADNGAFEYLFTPEQGKTYDFCLEAADTAGKTNDVEATRKELTLSDEDVSTQVRDALANLTAAYSAKDTRRFMTLVSPDFTGDAVLLDRALQKDFSALDNISLRFSVNNIAAGNKGMVYVSLLFNRSVVLIKSGAPFTDSGTTEFFFQPSAKGLLVYRMKNPLMFGVSDTEDVGQGGQTGGNNLMLDDKGSQTSQTASIKAAGPMQSFNFADETVNDEAAIGHPLLGDFAINIHFELKSGVGVQDLGVKPIAEITSVPASGYGTFSTTTIGNSYAFDLGGGKRAAIEMVSQSGTAPNLTYTFKYKKFF